MGRYGTWGYVYNPSIGTLTRECSFADVQLDVASQSAIEVRIAASAWEFKDECYWSVPMPNAKVTAGYSR